MMLKIKRRKINKKKTSASIGIDFIMLLTTIFISAILFIVRKDLIIRIVLIADIFPAFISSPSQPIITTVKSKIFHGSLIYEFFSTQNPKLITLSTISKVNITKNIISAIFYSSVSSALGSYIAINIQLENMLKRINLSKYR